MKATTLLQKMETRFPEKKFNVSEFQDSNYKIAHIEIDSKMAFEQIIDGLGWKEEKITEATEKLVLQYEETFNKINEELKKGTYVKKEKEEEKPVKKVDKKDIVVEKRELLYFESGEVIETKKL